MDKPTISKSFVVIEIVSLKSCIKLIVIPGYELVHKIESVVPN